MGLNGKPANPLLAQVWAATGDPHHVRVGRQLRGPLVAGGLERSPEDRSLPVTDELVAAARGPRCERAGRASLRR